MIKHDDDKTIVICTNTEILPKTIRIVLKIKTKLGSIATFSRYFKLTDSTL